MVKRFEVLLLGAGLVLASPWAELASRGEQTQTPFLLLDQEYLSTVRAGVRSGDAALKPSIAALEADAKKALAITPPSVMDKTIKPPSGDKHDYQTPDGRTLKRALDFMVPFATGEQKWTYEQIGGFRPDIIHGLLRRAAVGMKDPQYRALATRIGGGTPRMDLLIP